MKIKNVVCAPGRTGFYFDDQRAIKRGAGQSAIASAAYRAGEKLHSEYYGEISDYTRKGGVISC